MALLNALPLPLPAGGLKSPQIQGRDVSRYVIARVKNACDASMNCKINWNSEHSCRRGRVVAQSSAPVDIRRRLLSNEDTGTTSETSEDAAVSQFPSFELRGSHPTNDRDSDTGARERADEPTTPLLEALKECAAQDAASFHFPGHRRGLGAPSRMVETVGISAFAHDLPELPGLDNLFSPEGVIAEAQGQAAALFGANATFFLVNGSTCGIQASVMATCQPGDYLILPRNCHLSATSAMILSGALPKYVLPLYDSQWGIAHGVASQDIETAITEVRENGGRIGAVLVVSPTYFGVCSAIDKIAEVCHNNDVALIVDEAHGAHFKFHEDLPQSALEQGADIAVQSTHKVLGSLTQSSMLHVRGRRVSHEIIGKCLQMVQSTSPSYLLLSSLDAARAQMSEGGTPSKLKKALEHAAKASERLKAIPSLFVMDMDTIMHDCGRLPALDPLRVTVGLWGLCIDGFEADDILRLEYGVIAELPASRTITFAVSLGTCERDIDRLVESFEALATRFSKQVDSRASAPPHEDEVFNSSALRLSSDIGLSPRDAFFCRTVKVNAAHSIGEICAELVCPYPPGIPVLTPGEVITEGALSYLRSIVKRGGSISGALDSKLSTIQICQR